MYCDGCIAFEVLKIGIPKSHNEFISKFLDMGHSEVFETRICQLDEEAHPENQVHVNIYIKRKEK